MKRRGAVLFCALLLVLGGCDGGGGDGDDDAAELLAAPEFDLTGCWGVEALPYCQANVRPAEALRASQIDYIEPLTDAELDEIEQDYVAAEPLRLRQDGNDLEITDTGNGHRVYGTVAGDQVRFGDREELLGFETVWEAEGTALSKNVLALTITYEFSSTEVEGAVVCELRPERIVDASEACIEAEVGEPEP